MALDKIPEATTSNMGSKGVCRISPARPTAKTSTISAIMPTHNRIVLTEIASILDDRYFSRILLPAHANEAPKAMNTPDINSIITYRAEIQLQSRNENVEMMMLQSVGTGF